MSLLYFKIGYILLVQRLTHEVMIRCFLTFAKQIAHSMVAFVTFFPFLVLVADVADVAVAESVLVISRCVTSLSFEIVTLVMKQIKLALVMTMRQEILLAF